MDKAELLGAFEEKLELFEKYQGFVDKAQGYSERFNPAVVEKVVADYTAKAHEVSGELDPMVGELRSVVATIEAERDTVERNVGDAKLAVEELELRLAIGELDQDAFDQESGELKDQVEAASVRVGEINEELSAFDGALTRWLDQRPEDLGEVAEAPAPEPEPVADVALVDDAADNRADDDLLGELEEEEDALDLGLDGADAFGDAEEAAFEDAAAEGVHVESVHAQDDVSAVFADEPAAMEAGDAEPVFSDSDLDGLGGDDLAEPAPAPAPVAAKNEPMGMLIYSEGTSEEHVYQLAGEAMSIGRGRDNTVQVKNDSKVSRYHCKLYQKGNEFFVEDQQSANGTLVNGDLVKERMLVGGEEVVIGETYFRFRVQR